MASCRGQNKIVRDDEWKASSLYYKTQESHDVKRLEDLSTEDGGIEA